MTKMVNFITINKKNKVQERGSSVQSHKFTSNFLSRSFTHPTSSTYHILGTPSPVNSSPGPERVDGAVSTTVGPAALSTEIWRQQDLLKCYRFIDDGGKTPTDNEQSKEFFFFFFFGTGTGIERIKDSDKWLEIDKSWSSEWKPMKGWETFSVITTSITTGEGEEVKSYMWDQLELVFLIKLKEK